MPTRTPAKRSTERGSARAAVVLLCLAMLGGGVLLLANRQRPPAAMSPAQAARAGPGPAAAGANAGSRRPVPEGVLPRSLPDELDTLVTSDPARALARISAARPSSDEEARRLQVLEVRALVKLGRIGAARSRAAAYYARWPAGPDAAFLGQLTGRHPTPSR